VYIRSAGELIKIKRRDLNASIFAISEFRGLVACDRRCAVSASPDPAATHQLHPAATDHPPAFITAPGETDVLMVVMAFVLLGAVLAFGILFLRLHSLPERMAHKGHKIQFEIVAVLCLIALFTHLHIFWIAALLLALIDIPDFGGSLGRIAGSVEKMAGVEPGEGAAEVPDDTLVKPSEGTVEGPRENVAVIRRSEGTAAVPARPELAPASTRS
jgi:hypothetical protein